MSNQMKRGMKISCCKGRNCGTKGFSWVERDKSRRTHKHVAGKQGAALKRLLKLFCS